MTTKELFEAIKELNRLYEGEVYHLSEKNLDGKILSPKIPDNYMTKNGYEDNTTERVCFCKTIDGCLMALSDDIKDKEYFIHVPDGYYKIVEPENVPDSKLTGEVWICEDVKLKCIGKLKVISPKNKPYTYKYGKNKQAALYKWNYKIIDKK